MTYKFSHCICVETPNSEEAAQYYQDVFGMEFSMRQGNSIEVKSGDKLIYFDKSEEHRTIFEFVREELYPARSDV